MSASQSRRLKAQASEDAVAESDDTSPTESSEQLEELRITEEGDETTTITTTSSSSTTGESSKTVVVETTESTQVVETPRENGLTNIVNEMLDGPMEGSATMVTTTTVTTVKTDSKSDEGEQVASQ